MAKELTFEELYQKADYLMGKIEGAKNPPGTALNILRQYLTQLHALCDKNNGGHVNCIEVLQDRIDKFYKEKKS